MKRKQRDITRFEVQKRSVCDFFQQDKERWKKVLPFLRGENGLTLRLLEHFVSCYARKYVCETRNTHGVINVYHNMQTALRHGMNKKRLDPFNRRHCSDAEAIVMEDGTNTNVGQLTFFRWALVTGSLEFVCEHKEEIRADMAEVNRQLQKKRKSDTSPPETVREIVVEMPPELADDPDKQKQLNITLRERLQQPKKRRKRIRDDKVEAVARVSSSRQQPILEIKGAKI